MLAGGLPMGFNGPQLFIYAAGDFCENAGGVGISQFVRLIYGHEL